MKKIIIAAVIAVLVVAAYLGQVAYMGTLNQKVFDIFSQPNDFVSVEDMKFEKGFFTSKANFRLYIKTDAADLFSFGLGQMPISVDVRFKNNVFARDNVIISIENPFFELLKDNFGEQMTMDKTLLNAKISVSLFGNINTKTEFSDIDIQQNELIIKLKKLSAESKMDLKGKIYGSKADLGELFINVPNYYGADKIAIKNLHYDERLDKGVDFAEYVNQGFYSNKVKASIEQMQVYEISITGIESNSQSSTENGLGKGSVNTSIKSISSPLLQIQFDNINSTLEMSNISLQALVYMQNLGESADTLSDFNEFVRVFFDTNPSIELKSLTFKANEKNVSSKGSLKGSSKEYSINFLVESEATPSELVPPLQFLGIDQLFAQKDGKYILDFALQSDFENIKMSLNGVDISGDETSSIGESGDTPFAIQ